MTTQQTEEDRHSASSPAIGWRETIVKEYQKIKAHAETYPYVWGSYIVVYGGFGLWLGYRWRKLRRTEDRVRVLQERLRKCVEAENQASSKAASADKAPPPADKKPPSN